jgi:cytochrome P450
MDLPREVLPGGLYLDEDHFFPAGTVLGVPTYALHHDEEYFARPFQYDPSRWLLRENGGEGVSAEVMTHQRKAFVPFSLGPRACIGRSLAIVELEISIARVLWMYDLRLAPGTEGLGVGRDGEYKMRDNFIVGKKGPVLQFREVVRG